MREEDKNILVLIINITHSLMDNLEELYLLEIDGKKDSFDFDKAINSIRQTILLEQSLYEEITDSFDRIKLFINYVANNKYYGKISEDLDAVIDDDKDKLIKIRIIQNLFERINTPNIHLELYNNPSYCIDDIKWAVTKDVINTILKLLDLELDNNLDIKSYLCKYKYNIAFVYNFVLSDFLNNNFDINKDLYWSSLLYESLYNIDPNILKAFYTECAFDILGESSDRLGNISNISLKEKQIMANAVMEQIIIRSSLLFMDKNEIEEIKSMIEKSVIISKLVNGGSLSEEMLLNAVNNYEKDREVPMILRMVL